MARVRKNRKKPAVEEQNTEASNSPRRSRSLLKPKTPNQAAFLDALDVNTVVLATGPAGSGKTKLSVAYGIERLLKKQYKRLIITRPVVEAGEHLGYLPGSFSEKLDPYLQPIYYELSHYVTKKELDTFINNGLNKRGENEIIIAPLAYMRGMNYHESYMILDECQNCTKEQIKLFVTRVGMNSKAVLVGDDKQSDLPDGKSGLYYWKDKLVGIDQVASITLDRSDIVRNEVISKILQKIGE